MATQPFSNDTMIGMQVGYALAMYASSEWKAYRATLPTDVDPNGHTHACNTVKMTWQLHDQGVMPCVCELVRFGCPIPTVDSDAGRSGA